MSGDAAGCAPIHALATPHLDLVPLDATHAALHRALYTDPRVMARIAAPLDDAAAARAFRATLEANRADDPVHRTWVAVERGTGVDLGIGALIRRTADTEIGLMLRPAGWNGRYSHELIHALIAHAFDDLAVERLTGICRSGANERMSRRLLAPHGFDDAPPDRPGTARWVLERGAWTRPIGSTAASG